jgi:hypothetical protein
MHPLFTKADRLSAEVIGAATLVHRIMGPGSSSLTESQGFSYPVQTSPEQKETKETKTGSRDLSGQSRRQECVTSTSVESIP